MSRYAPVLFLILDEAGTIERMNAFAGEVIGHHCIGEPLQSVIIDYHQNFSLEAASHSPEVPCLLNIETPPGGSAPIGNAQFVHALPEGVGMEIKELCRTARAADLAAGAPHGLADMAGADRIQGGKGLWRR